MPVARTSSVAAPTALPDRGTAPLRSPGIRSPRTSRRPPAREEALRCHADATHRTATPGRQPPSAGRRHALARSSNDVRRPGHPTTYPAHRAIASHATRVPTPTAAGQTHDESDNDEQDHAAATHRPPHPRTQIAPPPPVQVMAGRRSLWTAA